MNEFSDNKNTPSLCDCSFLNSCHCPSTESCRCFTCSRNQTNVRFASLVNPEKDWKDQDPEVSFMTPFLSVYIYIYIYKYIYIFKLNIL